MNRSKVHVLYDGQCPLCTSYWRTLQTADSAARFELVDARTDTALRREAEAAGLDVDAAVAVKVGDRWLHGAAAVHAAAAQLDSGPTQRCNALLFRSRRLTQSVYPMLTAGRGLLLRLLGRERIGELGDN
jgi:predicted DCC family thiol-disulfide oxidoreductase YuxK